MGQHLLTVTIDAPRNQVWVALGDYKGIENYSPSIASATLLTDQNGGVGAVRVWEISGMGKTHETVAKWTEGEGYTVEIARMGMMDSSVSDISLSGDQPNRTTVTMRVRYQMRFGVLGSLLDALFVNRMMVKNIRDTLAGLKYHVETGETVGKRLPVAARL